MEVYFEIPLENKRHATVDKHQFYRPNSEAGQLGKRALSPHTKYVCKQKNFGLLSWSHLIAQEPLNIYSPDRPGQRNPQAGLRPTAHPSVPENILAVCENLVGGVSRQPKKLSISRYLVLAFFLFICRARISVMIKYISTSFLTVGSIVRVAVLLIQNLKSNVRALWRFQFL